MKLSWLLPICLFGALFATLGAFLGADRYEVKLSGPIRPVINVSLLCPPELASEHGLTLDTLPGTVTSLNRQARHLREAKIQIDTFHPVDRVHFAPPPDQALFHIDITTGDGSRMVSRDHHVPFEELDTAMADCVDQAVAGFLDLRSRLGTRAGPLTVYNF